MPFVSSEKSSLTTPRYLSAQDTSPRSWYALGVFVLAAFLANMDNQILVLNIEAIRRSLSLSDTQIGLLQGVAAVAIGSLGAYPLSWLADRHDRRFVLAGCIAVWSLAAAARGGAVSFEQLFAVMVVMGIGESGLFPIVSGMIPDLFGREKRQLANAVFSTVNTLGAALGLMLCSLMMHAVDSARWLLPSTWQAAESWRQAVIATAVPGALVFLLVLSIRPEAVELPRQSSAEGSHSEASLLAHMYRYRLAMAGFFGGWGLMLFGLAAVLSWVGVIAMRVHHVDPATVGRTLGIVIAMGTLAGVLLGLAASRSLAKMASPIAAMRVMWICGIGAAWSSAALLFTSSLTGLLVATGCMFSMFMAGATLAPTLSQDLTPPKFRSRVIATGAMVMLLGKSLSPLVVGILSDVLAGRPDGLAIAVGSVSAFAFLTGSLVLWRAEKPVSRAVDEISWLSEAEERVVQ